ncbi:MAG: sensor histidine kinase [Planctomycetota bacterium]
MSQELAREVHTSAAREAASMQIREAHESYSRLLLRIASLERDLSRANAELKLKIHDLENQKSTLEAVIHAVPGGVIVASESGVITHANPLAHTVIGAPEGSLVGVRLKDVRNKNGTMLCEGREGEHEFEILDGSIRILMRRRSQVVDTNNTTIGSVDLIEDRTERRELELKMAQRERLASVGEMSAMVAHEVRNPLHAIDGFANLLLRSVSDSAANPKARLYAGHIVKGVSELNAVVSNLLEFARVDRFTPQKRDIIPIIKQCADTCLAASLAAQTKNVVIKYEFNNSPIISIDEVQIAQAVRNLILNAIDAVGANGEITIRAQEQNHGFSIQVADNGPGVRPDARHRIFAPFFTTKSRGTGLGLAVVAKVATLHGGKVSLDSTPRGATFTLWIPHNKSQEY